MPQVLGRLSLAEQVEEQLFMVGVAGDVAGSQLTAAMRSYHFGSLLLTKSAAGTVALARQTTAMQGLVGTSGLGLFIAANQEGGQVQQLTGPGFATMPSALVQGSWPDSVLRAAATQWGTDLRAAAVNLNLAPVMDVVPEATAAGSAPIGALDAGVRLRPGDQRRARRRVSSRGWPRPGVETVYKHFPGLGRVTGKQPPTSPPDVTDDGTTAERLVPGPAPRRDRHAGVPMVMVASATYTRIDPSQLAVFSPGLIMRLLRDGLGFAGVIVSDDLGQAQAVQAIPAGKRALSFSAAGGDLITLPESRPRRADGGGGARQGIG